MIDTILFDLEGVIIDTERSVWVPSAVEFLRRRNLEYHEEIVKPLMMGKTMEEGAQIMKDYYGLAGDIVELAEERRIITRELFETNVAFVPGFEAFFETIAGKYKLAVASSIERKFLEMVDRHLHLSALFGEHMYSIADIGYISKPHPDIFLYAANKLGVTPVQCIVIEDSPHGVEAGKRAGMKVIALTTSGTKEKLTAADQIVDSFSEISIPVL